MRKIFGPYKGSKQNGGRPIYVFKRRKKNGEVATTSSNKARVDYEKSTGQTRTTKVVLVMTASLIFVLFLSLKTWLWKTSAEQRRSLPRNERRKREQKEIESKAGSSTF